MHNRLAQCSTRFACHDTVSVEQLKFYTVLTKQGSTEKLCMQQDYGVLSKLASDWLLLNTVPLHKALHLRLQTLRDVLVRLLVLVAANSIPDYVAVLRNVDG